ncbi:MAG: hypothetical protein FWC60_09255 [Firmicutes bacterium]|nr:hypothetical protein [Bacillota bacterium]
MRKQDAQFNTAFLTNEGSQLHNKDYFRFVELDNLACYIIADGIETWQDVNSAQTAVEAVAAAFIEHPSIGRGAVARYIRTAHMSLAKTHRNHEGMRASITVVVTDYAVLRYGYVGNTRFCLYRGEQLLALSADHSLAWAIIDRQGLPKDRVAQHKERTNLSRYLGQKDYLSPQISRKIKLKDGDMFALFTRGIWENCRQYDLQVSLAKAERDPQKAVEIVENLILDNGIKHIDNYTLAAIFVDKVFVDPNRAKKVKRVLQIIIPLLVIMIVVGIVLYVFHAKWQENKRNMDQHYQSGIEYIQNDDYTKAQSELDQAYQLALKIKDTSKSDEISQYRKLAEEIINADQQFKESNYQAAEQGYLKAQNQSRYADLLGQSYIDRQLKLTADYIIVRDDIGLGDMLTDRGYFPQAKVRYTTARDVAAEINDQQGRQQAISALEAMDKKQEQQAAQQAAKDKERSQKALDAVSFIAQGDEAYQQGDLVNAKLYYFIAKGKYAELNDELVIGLINQRLEQVEQKQQENDARLKQADEYVSAGDQYQDSGNYEEAKKQYILARAIYTELNQPIKLYDIQAKIDAVNAYLTGAQPSEQLNGQTNEQP